MSIFLKKNILNTTLVTTEMNER